MTQERFYVLADITSCDGNWEYIGKDEDVTCLDDPNIRVFTDRNEAVAAAKRELLAGRVSPKVIRVHRDFLDVAATP